MDEALLKIIFAGSAGSGKTSSINSVSDIKTLPLEEIETDDETREIIENPAVTMDYGQMHLKDRTRIHLYGAPSQDSFDFIWNILSLDALGVVILINNGADNPLDDLDLYLDTFSQHLRNRSVVIGITNTDVSQNPDIEAYRVHVNSLDQNIPIFTLDARNPDMVKTLVKVLMYRKDMWLN